MRTAATLVALAALISTMGLEPRAASAAEARPQCETTYDAAAKAAVVSLLKARYGDAYRGYDVDHPGWALTFAKPDEDEVVTTASGTTRVDPHHVYWRGFSRKPGAARVPAEISIAFERCSNSKIIGYKIESAD
jgi:hypothetical protein